MQALIFIALAGLVLVFAVIVLVFVQLVKTADAIAKVVAPVILGSLGFPTRRADPPFRMLGTRAWARAIELRCQR